MQTVTFRDAEMAQFVADQIRPYGVLQPAIDGATLTIDDDALSILADLDGDADGHYDGTHIWVGGTEYAVTQLGRSREGKAISLRVPADHLTAGTERAKALGVDRSELFRRYIAAGLSRPAFTVQIEATSDGTAWQAIAPSEIVEADLGETAQDVAEWTASNQTEADGDGWRILVWDGTDTSADPAAVLQP